MRRVGEIPRMAKAGTWGRFYLSLFKLRDHGDKCEAGRWSS